MNRVRPVGGYFEDNFEALDREDSYSLNYDSTRVTNEDFNFKEYFRLSTVSEAIKSQTELKEVSSKIPQTLKIGNQSELRFDNPKVAEPLDKQPTMAEAVKNQPKTAKESLAELIDIPIFLSFTTKEAKAAFKETKEFGSAVYSMLKDWVFFKLVKKQETPEQKAKQQKEQIRTINKKNFFDSLKRAFNPESLKRRFKAMQEEVNKKLGISADFQDSLDPAGQVRADLQTLLEKKNSELDEQQKKQIKEVKVKQVMKKKDFTLDLNQHEGGSRVTGPMASVG